MLFWFSSQYRTERFAFNLMAGEVAWPQPNGPLGTVSDRSEAFGRFLSAQERGPYTLGEWVLAWTPHVESVEWNDYPQVDYLADQKSALTTQARSWRQQQLQCGGSLHREPVGEGRHDAGWAPGG
ncbi:hypothetical protein TcYC6_0099500 [Trypanosoma cruzi]|nr:hypothetical protein TcYC6_0099530 [Trypanosoma cruzi]KAF8294700.1 hypothetical protein TcYC6_0099500 [Trypanosoma cruzi]